MNLGAFFWNLNLGAFWNLEIVSWKFCPLAFLNIIKLLKHLLIHIDNSPGLMLTDTKV